MRMNTEYGMTVREFEMWKTKALARNDVQENLQKFRNKITDADVAYINNAAEAPDVNLFLKVI